MWKWEARKTLALDVIKVLAPGPVKGAVEQKSKDKDSGLGSTAYWLCVLHRTLSEFCFPICEGEGQYFTWWLQMWVLNKIMVLWKLTPCKAPAIQTQEVGLFATQSQNGVVQQTLQSSNKKQMLEGRVKMKILLCFPLKLYLPWNRQRDNYLRVKI